MISSQSSKQSIYFDIFSKNFILYEGLHRLKERKLKDHFKIYESYEDFSSFVEYLLKPFKNLPISKLGDDIIELKEIQAKTENYMKNKYDYMFKNFNVEKFREFENITLLFFMFSEFDNYLFKCFKHHLIERPELLFDKQILIENVINKIKDLDLDPKEKIENNIIKKLIIDSIVEDYAEKTIHDRFYENYEEIFNYAQKKLGINHNIDSKALKLLNLFKQFRNLYAHSDGIISYIFLNKVEKIGYKTKYFKSGEKLKIDDEIIDDVKGMIFGISLEFDGAFIESHPELKINNKE